MFLEYITLHRHCVYKIQFSNSPLGKDTHNSLLNFLPSSYLCNSVCRQKTTTKKSIDNSSLTFFYLFVAYISFFPKDLKVYLLGKQRSRVL